MTRGEMIKNRMVREIEKKISVVIPNYNGKKDLAVCLKSLYEGTLIPEIIVVDNGSTDESLAFLEEKYPRVKRIALEKNTGFAHAANRGIQEAGTDYVFLLNNDTLVDKDAIRFLFHFMERHPGALAVQAKMLQKNRPDRIDSAGDFYCGLGWAFSLGKDKDRRKYRKTLRVSSACAGAALYRRRIFRRLGGFDEAHFCYLEDVDLGIRAGLLGYPSYMEPEALVYHVGSASSGSKYNVFKTRLTVANNLYLLYKNLPLPLLVLNGPWILAGILIKALFFVRMGQGKAYRDGLEEGVAKIKAYQDRRAIVQEALFSFDSKSGKGKKRIYLRLFAFQAGLFRNMLYRFL